MEYSHVKVNFLDTTIYFNGDGRLESTLYTIHTGICTWLHRDSFHPESCKRGIIYSQALRYRRITTKDHLLIHNLNILKHNLILRGYRSTEIDTEFNKVLLLTQHSLLHTPNIDKNNHTRKLPFIIAYNNTSAGIGSILQRHWHLIEGDRSLSSIWDGKPFLALRKNKNLRGELVHTALSP